MLTTLFHIIPSGGVFQSNAALTDWASLASQLALRIPAPVSEITITSELPSVPSIYVGSEDPNSSPLI